jgi:hypothetical protein
LGVEPLRENRPMLRAKLFGSLVVALWWASLARSQEPPRLEAPVPETDPPSASAPPQTAPATSAPTPAKPPAKPPAPPTPPGTTGSQVRPMLVIPGVTAPASRVGSPAKPAIPQPSRSTGVPITGPRETSPALAAPPDPGSPFRPAPGRTVQSRPDPSARQSIPLSIEPLEDDKPSDRERVKPGPAGGASTGPRSGNPRRTGRSSATVEQPGQAGNNSGEQRSSTWRMPGMLGRLLGQPTAGPTRPSSRAIASEPKPERQPQPGPETDTAVKRKIEKQINDALGDRVRSVEVRVSGRNVLIVAKATRFWQKRPIRRSLETLPVLSGYRARIELED